VRRLLARLRRLFSRNEDEAAMVAEGACEKLYEP